MYVQYIYCTVTGIFILYFFSNPFLASLETCPLYWTVRVCMWVCVVYVGLCVSVWTGPGGPFFPRPQ